MVSDGAISGHDAGGSKKEEGWPCESNSDCQSGMCGDDEVEKERGTLTASGRLADRNSDRRLTTTILRI